MTQPSTASKPTQEPTEVPSTEPVEDHIPTTPPVDAD